MIDLIDLTDVFEFLAQSIKLFDWQIAQDMGINLPMNIRNKGILTFDCLFDIRRSQVFAATVDDQMS